jgi:hypothetical protein
MFLLSSLKKNSYRTERGIFFWKSLLPGDFNYCQKGQMWSKFKIKCKEKFETKLWSILLKLAEKGRKLFFKFVYYFKFCLKSQRDFFKC